MGNHESQINKKTKSCFTRKKWSQSRFTKKVYNVGDPQRDFDVLYIEYGGVL